MEANELRVGNIVHLKRAYDKPNGMIIRADVSTIKNPNTVKPIPLTQEWLIKFGGKYSSGEVGVDFKLPHDAEDVLWVRLSDITVFIGNDSDFEYAVAVNCEYVHSFQNLYFALTGEELTINE